MRRVCAVGSDRLRVGTPGVDSIDDRGRHEVVRSAPGLGSVKSLGESDDNAAPARHQAIEPIGPG